MNPLSRALEWTGAFLRGTGFRIFDATTAREFDDAAVDGLARHLGAKGYTNLLASRLPPADLIA